MWMHYHDIRQQNNVKQPKNNSSTSLHQLPDGSRTIQRIDRLSWQSSTAKSRNTIGTTGHRENGTQLFLTEQHTLSETPRETITDST